ncbi:MAG: PepSY-like domain-containing protein [Flavobacteriales bacterium]|nr:PepSY-like domain-containing protein [Flavobacteriales bacterium]
MNNSKNLIACCLLLSSACGFAGAKETTPPPAVLSAFAERFPHAQGVKWEEEEGGVLEAEFVSDGLKQSANFMLDGTWKETEQRITEADLTDAIRATLETRHPGATVKHAERVSTPTADLYEVELKTAQGKVEVMITAEGAVVEDAAKDKD